MTLRIRSRLRWAFLPLPNAPAQTFDFGDDHSRRRRSIRLVGRQIGSRQLRVLQPHRDMKPIENRPLGDPTLARIIEG
jgi:hypothetical protein